MINFTEGKTGRSKRIDVGSLIKNAFDSVWFYSMEWNGGATKLLWLFKKCLLFIKHHSTKPMKISPKYIEIEWDNVLNITELLLPDMHMQNTVLWYAKLWWRWWWWWIPESWALGSDINVLLSPLMLHALIIPHVK